MRIEIRIIESTEKERLGVGSVIDEMGNAVFTFCTLELPYKNNQRQISSIDLGKYRVRKRFSEKYGNHFELISVKNRDKILIHVANFVRELKGCIAVGSAHKDIDNDGTKDLINSRKTLNKLNAIMPYEFELIITH
ncbi:MAG: hypothetical protein IPK62_16950 [Bacteroidetes bacterium]|nr:hypothetical protein [Bacteroidota bacterium]